MAISKIDPAGLDVGQIGGRRNLIINGKFSVWQRGESTAITPDTNLFVADRWRFRDSVYDNGDVTVSRSSDAPSGFSDSILVSSTAAEPDGVSGSEYSRFQYYFEGQELQHIFTGDENAPQITVSFWVKCAKTGQLTLGLELPFPGYTICLKKFNINSANTWEYKTLTFPANTTRTVSNDNSQQMRMTLCVANSDQNWKGLSDGVWSSDGAYYQGSVGDMNIYEGVSGDLFWMTGFQMEVGDRATPFEHRSYGEELALCQRYYQRKSSLSGNYVGFGNLAAITANTAFGSIDYIGTMRTNPSFSISNCALYENNTIRSINNLSTAYYGDSSFSINITITSSVMGVGNVASLIGNNNSNAYVEFDAEL